MVQFFNLVSDYVECNLPQFGRFLQFNFLILLQFHDLCVENFVEFVDVLEFIEGQVLAQHGILVSVKDVALAAEFLQLIVGLLLHGIQLELLLRCQLLLVAHLVHWLTSRRHLILLLLDILSDHLHVLRGWTAAICSNIGLPKLVLMVDTHIMPHSIRHHWLLGNAAGHLHLILRARIIEGVCHVIGGGVPLLLGIRRLPLIFNLI